MGTRLIGIVATAVVSVALLTPAPASAVAVGPQIVRADNGGHRCTDTMRTLGEFANQLFAYATDPTAPEHSIVTYRFHLWPVADPTQATVLTDETELGSLGRATVPDGVLVSSASYVWRARVATSSGVSPWSAPCSFTYYDTAPAAPGLTSANYPEETWGPPGELVQFTFDGNGDADVAGFYYSWGTPPLYACAYSGPHGVLVCPPVFGQPGSIHANREHSASIALNPPGDGLQRLTVRALDRAGNESPPVTYQVYVSPTYPTVTTIGPQNCGGTTTLHFTPNELVGTVVSWNYQIEYGAPITQVQAAPDGTAQVTVTTVTDTPVRVQSVSANGFTSSWAYPLAYFRPSVTGSPYVPGMPAGGPGQPGTFSVQGPFGTPVAAYRYLFVGESPVVLTADPSTGSATFDWTPQAAGPQRLLVRARTADGHWSCATSYRFRVAGG